MAIVAATVACLSAETSAARKNAADTARFALERLLLVVSDAMPARAALGLADLLGWLDSLGTRKGRTAVIEARQICGRQGDDAWRLARSRLTVPYRDLVELRRLARGRDTVLEWDVDEVNADRVHQFIDSGQPIVVATGHFAFASLLGLVSRFPNVDSAVVTAESPPFSWHGEVLRARMVRSLIKQVSERVTLDLGRRGASGMLRVGGPGIGGLVRHNLANPGSAVLIFIDAYWPDGNAVTLPFVGHRAQPFGLGAAAIARIWQCPVVVVAPERTRRKAIRLHFGEVVMPPERRAKSEDGATMRALVDDLGLAIGRFREQYPGPVGWERRWDPVLDRWINSVDDLADSGSADTLPAIQPSMR